MQYPHTFFILSPVGSRNLCYSGCLYHIDGEKLSCKLANDIIADIRDNYSDHFVVITGGEPFIESGKILLDIFKEFDDLFFFVKTNGILIDEELAQKLAQLGNVSPVISVEGFEMETDGERGSGVHQKILKAMENLREAGLAFGIAITVNKNNIDVLLDDFFYDYYFEEQGATFMWHSQMTSVPNDKNQNDLIPSPEKRSRLYHKCDQIIRDKRYCVSGFWSDEITSQTHQICSRSIGRIFLY
jgi:MoaA/NifB/PqqE/SkfB family radical SAM enzyme